MNGALISVGYERMVTYGHVCNKCGRTLNTGLESSEADALAAAATRMTESATLRIMTKDQRQ